MRVGEPPLQRRPKIVVIGVQANQPGGPVVPSQAGLAPLSEVQETRRVSPPEVGLLAGRCQLLQPELADRLQHREARLAIRTFSLAQKALGGQRRHAVQHVEAERSVRIADGLGSLQGAAADEDRQAAVERLLLGREQVVAPGDGVPQGLLAGGKIASAAGQEGKAASRRWRIACGVRSGCGQRRARWRAGGRRGGDRSRRWPGRSRW